MQSPSLLADTLLRHLEREESLLRTALAGATEVYAALRGGDLATALGATAQQALATELRETAGARSAAATALAGELGLSDEALTLSGLAARLPESHAAQLRAARDRLAALTTELSAVQSRNANLVSHLRSYFRGVLSELTAPDVPVRYGPSGSRLGSHPITRYAQPDGGEQTAVPARG
jgi:hypothetical protein